MPRQPEKPARASPTGGAAPGSGAQSGEEDSRFTQTASAATGGVRNPAEMPPTPQSQEVAAPCPAPSPPGEPPPPGEGSGTGGQTDRQSRPTPKRRDAVLPAPHFGILPSTWSTPLPRGCSCGAGVLNSLMPGTARGSGGWEKGTFWGKTAPEQPPEQGGGRAPASPPVRLLPQDGATSSERGARPGSLEGWGLG